MVMPIYYTKEANILYRRRDGNPDRLPDQVLWREGWRGLPGSATVSADSYPKPSRRGTIDGGGDPSLWLKISRVTEEKAREVAEGRGLTLRGWGVAEEEDTNDDKAPASNFDAEHDFILNNSEADQWIGEQAVKRAMGRGMDRAKAERLYAYKKPLPEPTVEDLNRIANEITLGLAPARKDTPKEAKARAKMTVEIEDAKERGMIIQPVRE
jgi:hypothetical protein